MNQVSKDERIRPILKSAGGKGKIAHLIKAEYDKSGVNRFVDLFAGGLAAPLYILPEEVVVNDLNPYLINFYRYIRLFGTIDHVELKNEETYYYERRTEFNTLISDKDWQGHVGRSFRVAELYYYLNRSCFNGLMRFNKSGLFNSPFGHYKYPAYQTSFPVHQELFKKWTISEGDWKSVKLKSDDFIFSDSPYDTDFVAYTSDGFSWQDQVDLANHLAAHNGPVLVTNQATERIIELYSDLGFKIDYTTREDKINSHRPKGNKVREIFATKNI